MFVLYLIILALLLFYYYSTRNHNYWANRNVKHEKPVPIFGTHFRNLFGYKSITDISEELYNKYKDEKVVGYYRGNTPELIVRDPELVKRILNVDFAYFYMRGLTRNDALEPLLLSLFHVEGDRWKLLRQRLTSAFTTHKLKGMFPLVVQCAGKLQAAAAALAARAEPYDVRELMARFTTEFIGACGFGIEMDTINNEHSQFRDLGKLIFTPSRRFVIFNCLMEVFPFLKNHIALMNPEIELAIRKLFEQIQKQRNYAPIGRNDFVDLLLELEKKGKMCGESIENVNKDGQPLKVEMDMDMKMMVAQLFVFFAAGFETSSSATSYTLHQLAYNPDIQTRVQEDIDRVMSKYDNKLCYEAIAEMTLLDMAFKESMRKFPSLGVLNRVCAKKYVIPELDITLDPGVKILIPVQAIQHDEQYFDNPFEYRPERFEEDAVKDRHKFVYLPFGEGPRSCIGARLGQMQSMAGLAALLHRFTFEPSALSTPQLTVNPFANNVQGLQKIYLKITERKLKTT
ncbi:probable cytochrome P450 6a18 [Plutella xylostella]|uniref:probable cytochrome P450 6a18 n=1 Tax=Plutella xylostella TaxID=51655 RepID=UPI002032968D|nr:probable cytochrome P450 6a18 [Plutella xylostella]